MQGFNAQAVATEDQFVIAAEVTNQAIDAPLYEADDHRGEDQPRRAGEKRRVRRVVADAGYWSDDNVHLPGVESFIAPGRARKLRQIAETEQRTPAEIIDRRRSRRDRQARGRRATRRHPWPGSIRSCVDAEPVTPTS